MVKEKPRLWTKDFIIYSAMSFLMALIFFTTITTLATFTMEEFHATESEGGLAASIFTIGIILTRLITGKYLDIIGRKRLFYFGLFSLFIVTIFYFFIHHIYFLIINRFFHGAFFGISLTVIQTAVLDYIPKERRGEGISLYSLSFIFSTAVGPFIGGFMIRFGINYLFIFCLITVVIVFILSLFIQIKEKTLTDEQRKELKVFHLNHFFAKTALPISMIMGGLAFTYSSVLSFLQTYGKELHLLTAASFFFLTYAMSVIVSRPISGRLLDIKGDNVVLYPSFIFLSISFLLLSQVQTSFILLLSGALMGLGYGNLQSSIQAIAIKVTPYYQASLATSTFFICMDSGMGMGPFFIGLLLPYLGFRHLFLLLSFIVVICMVFYYFAHGRKHHLQKGMTHANVER